MSLKTNKQKEPTALGEFWFVKAIANRIKYSRSVVKGIGDDAAIVSLSSVKKMLLSTDMLVEGIHFTKEMGYYYIGRKALACNVSDIAAMGGLPKFALVSLGIPKGVKLRDIMQVYKGIKTIANVFNIDIVGGDIVKSDKIIINVAITGEVLSKKAVLRSGAKKGDKIFVTGRLGNSLKTEKHLKFIPRVKESQYLINHFNPTSMIDISDGLVADLGHILKASKVNADLYQKQIPINKGADINNALYDGEDFELLFTLSQKDTDKLMLNKRKQFKFIYIGEIIKGKGKVKLIDKKGESKYIPIKGYSHF